MAFKNPPKPKRGKLNTSMTTEHFGPAGSRKRPTGRGGYEGRSESPSNRMLQADRSIRQPKAFQNRAVRVSRAWNAKVNAAEARQKRLKKGK